MLITKNNIGHGLLEINFKHSLDGYYFLAKDHIKGNKAQFFYKRNSNNTVAKDPDGKGKRTVYTASCGRVTDCPGAL